MEKENPVECKPCLTQIALDKANERIRKLSNFIFKVGDKLNEIDDLFDEFENENEE